MRDKEQIKAAASIWGFCLTLFAITAFGLAIARGAWGF